MPAKKLKELLDTQKVKYVTITHSPAYTAQEVAQSAHVSAKELAKTVMVKIDGKMAMAVMPANQKVDLGRLQDAVSARTVELATEEEFGKMFPECELGAMPPFGNLYGMDVYVSQKLTEDEKIAFNAGTHTELIQLAYEDFNKLVKPRVANFAF